MQKFVVYSCLSGLFLLQACQESKPEYLLTHAEDKAIISSIAKPLGDKYEDIDTISVRLNEYAMRLSPQDNEEQLSEGELQELSSWWDSLPSPLKSEIQEKKVDIQLVSKIYSGAQEGEEKEKQAGVHIGQTSQALERIIGQKTDMSYSLNKVERSSEQQGKTGSETSIVISKKVPVRLSEYSMEIFVRQAELSNENIQSLQYWWLSLPEELQDKIRRQELLVDISCYTVDRGPLDEQPLAVSADEYSELFADVLQQMIGYQKLGKGSLPIGKITMTSLIEPVQSHTKNVQYYFSLQLRPCKQFLEKSKPSMQ